jgi:ankyrin repeat protein
MSDGILSSIEKEGSKTPDLSEMSSSSGTLEEMLIEAVRSGSKRKVSHILGLGKININVKDENGYTPLHWAASHGHAEIMLFLIQFERLCKNS